jgi:diadenosine tetraphosphate (Ap4A) HIT family hydrolase
MPPFSLDDRLRDDTHVLGRVGEILVLLHRNATVPWFILVPRVNAQELHDLDNADAARLLDAARIVSRFVRDHFPTDKVNVAAIGNIVRQLHLHVVGRRADDPCWPGVVWGRLPDGPPWEPDAITLIVHALGQRLGFDHPFMGVPPPA